MSRDATRHRARATTNSADRDRARDLLGDADPDLRQLDTHPSRTTSRIACAGQLKTDEAAARKRENKRYSQREGEVSTLIDAESTVRRLEREIGELKVKREQGQLFDEAGALDKLDRSIEVKEQEIERRRSHYEEIRNQLRRERSRILNLLLPARFKLAGEARVFPVTAEVQPARLRERRGEVAADERQAKGAHPGLGPAAPRVACSSTVPGSIPWPNMCPEHWTNMSSGGCASVPRPTWAASTIQARHRRPRPNS